MGIFSNFKGNQQKNEIEQLRSEVDRLNSMMTPEMQNAVDLKKKIESLQDEAKRLEQEIKQKQQIVNDKLQQENQCVQRIKDLEFHISQRQQEIFKLDEEIGMQDFGIYRPRYDFATSDLYKNRLNIIRQRQKDMVKNNLAVSGNMNWTVNGSLKQGQKMVKDMQKLLIRAFNSECDELVDKVKYNNFDSAYKRMVSSCSAISKLGAIMQISISSDYFNLKEEELRLALEYRIKKQNEKEELKEARARMRDEAKLQKELEEARKKIKKEQSHYQNALALLEKQLCSANDAEKEELLKKKSDLENQLIEIDKSIKDIDYREANAKAGYVYIISNVGSFGENVYKIGMTRRLEPMDRVDELGDASVPFNFDVHALIFSDNAPALEASLHRAFENRKVNMINTRREFFQVTLDEIEAEVKKNYDKTVEFIRFAPAEQYRESLKIKECLQKDLQK